MVLLQRGTRRIYSIVCQLCRSWKHSDTVPMVRSTYRHLDEEDISPSTVSVDQPLGVGIACPVTVVLAVRGTQTAVFSLNGVRACKRPGDCVPKPLPFPTFALLCCHIWYNLVCTVCRSPPESPINIGGFRRPLCPEEQAQEPQHFKSR